MGLRILEEAGVRDLVEFYADESQIVLPRLLAEGRKLDFVFLDGNHRFEAVFWDLFYSGRLLREGGTVFVDDTQLPGVRRAVDFYVANLGWAQIGSCSTISRRPHLQTIIVVSAILKVGLNLNEVAARVGSCSRVRETNM